MTSIENALAGGIANINAGFTGQILGQANRINALQNGGAAAPTAVPQTFDPTVLRAALGQLGTAGPPMAPVRQLVGQMGAPDSGNLGLKLVRDALMAIKQNPQLMAMLSGPVRQLVSDVMQAAPQRCCCGAPR